MKREREEGESEEDRLFHKPTPTVFDLENDGESGADPKCVEELEIIAVSGSIRNKPNWPTKLRDETIRKKWLQELEADPDYQEKIVRYVFEELDGYYSKLVDGNVYPAAVEGTYQGDQLIEEDLKKDLMRGVSVLENVSDDEKDWHPNSKNQVLDLVHPSLFPFVLRVSPQIDGKLPGWNQFVGSGKVVEVPIVEIKPQSRSFWRNKVEYSEKYQWLPTEFQINNEGKVKILSYINNLHPIVHRDLYNTLAKIFERFLPLFSKVLGEALHRRPKRLDDDINYPPQKEKEEKDEDEMDEDEEEEEDRTPLPIDIPSFEPPTFPTPIDLRSRNLQVIVKLANIILTPENPNYEGGVWHVEGMKNERIVATGIYYYSNENITDSRLGFQETVHDPENYEQCDYSGVRAVYGLVNEEPAVQPSGSINTLENRCIAFPNLYLHKVEPFSLVDKTKPGHRKILVFFLVDPATKVISTKQVPPQQKSWYLMELQKLKGTYFENLPKEILSHVVDYMDWPMSLSQAKIYREDLMKERKFKINEDTKEIYMRPCSLCEH